MLWNGKSSIVVDKWQLIKKMKMRIEDESAILCWMIRRESKNNKEKNQKEGLILGKH